MNKSESLAQKIFFIYSIVFIIAAWWFLVFILAKKTAEQKSTNFNAFFNHCKFCPNCPNNKPIEKEIICVEGYKILKNNLYN